MSCHISMDELNGKEVESFEEFLEEFDCETDDGQTDYMITFTDGSRIAFRSRNVFHSKADQRKIGVKS